MITLSRRIISVVPIHSGVIKPAIERKDNLQIVNKEQKELEIPGPQNYSVTEGLSIYETSLEIFNKNRVVIVKERK